MSGALQAVFQNQRSFGAAPGSQSYTTAGSYSWVVPAGVTSVSVLVIGGGGGAGNSSSGGAGGGLAYRNSITVVPGTSLSVVVGAGGDTTNYTCCPCGNGGQSLFSASGVSTRACGGQNSLYGRAGGGPGGTYTGGGTGGSTYAWGSSPYKGGGGGAGGFNGCGGANTSTNGAAGANGAGGGGPSGTQYCVCCVGGYYGGGAGGGGGGVFGQGTTGGGNVLFVNSAYQSGGQAGSGGSYGSCGGPNNTGGAGGAYGGGAGARNALGAKGAVRIVWPGNTRTFPSTCVGSP